MTLSLREVVVPVLVGHMANNALPARTGELYRAHLLGRRTRMSRSSVVGSIVVERTFDGLMLVGLTLLLFVLFPETHLSRRRGLDHRAGILNALEVLSVFC